VRIQHSAQIAASTRFDFRARKPPKRTALAG
jgi:hypothetical protein